MGLVLLMVAISLVACSENTPTPTVTTNYPTPPPDNGLLATVTASPNKLILGISTPARGADGWTAVGGASIAGEVLNRGGGVPYNGVNYYLKFATHDDSAQPDGVAAAVTQIVNAEDALGLVGPSAAEGISPNLRLLNDLATPALLTLTSDTLLAKTKANPFLFYLRPLDSYWAEAVVTYLSSSSTLKPGAKIGLTSQQNDAGQSGAKHLKTVLAAKANSALAVEVKLPAFETKFQKEHNQYASQVQQLVAAAPDVVINWSDQDEAIELLIELRQKGWHGQFITTSLNERFATELKGEAEGIVGPATWTADATDPTSQRFVQLYQAYFHLTPDDHAAAVYDGINFLAQAYKQVGPDRAKIRDWLAHMSNQTGLQGVYNTLPSGEMLKTVKMAQIKNGKVVGIGNP